MTLKRFLSYLVVFGAGLGTGTLGGYVLNDLTSREDPTAIQQIRRELEQQQRLDDFFADRQAQRTARPSDGSDSGVRTDRREGTAVPLEGGSP